MIKDSNLLRDRITALEKEWADLRRERDEARGELRAEEEFNQAISEQNEDLKERVETLTGLLEEAKEHVPQVAVYGIDHRRIEEATRDAIQAGR